jgi:hypothetical protein
VGHGRAHASQRRVVAVVNSTENSGNSAHVRCILDKSARGSTGERSERGGAEAHFAAV